MQKVDYEDVKRIDATQGWLLGRYREPADTPGAHVLEYDQGLDFDPDGLSGGTVFHLGRDRDGFFVGFAGIVMKGSQFLRQLQFLGPGIPLRMIGEYLRDTAAPA